MAAVARSNGADRVFSLTGTGKFCRAPIPTTTGPGSGNVFVNGINPVVLGDAVGLHPANGCGPDTSSLSSASSTVFANGKRVGRISDQYTSDNTIITGSPTVFCS
jgi:uncharacterized Zn-binding protein involved in type VI secretion